MYGKIGVLFCTLLIISTVPDGPILIYPSKLSINSPILRLFGVIATLCVMLVLKSGRVGEYTPCAPRTTAGWQLSAACVVQNCHLVLKFAILSINLGRLVDHVLVGSMKISWRHGQVIYRNVGSPPRQYCD